MMTVQETLANGLETLQLALPLQAQQKLLNYIAVLEKWNRVYNLTAIREPEQMVSHHLLDSLTALKPLPTAMLQVLDVGSGGGMPGIPFAIARPQWHITLLDSNHKKTAFLRQAVIDLALKNVEVVTERVEQYQASVKFDLITSRAFADLSEFIRLTRHLLADQGQYAALKGIFPQAEIEQIPADIRVKETIALHVPYLTAERHLVIMQADI